MPAPRRRLFGHLHPQKKSTGALTCPAVFLSQDQSSLQLVDELPTAFTNTLHELLYEWGSRLYRLLRSNLSS